MNPRNIIKIYKTEVSFAINVAFSQVFSSSLDMSSFKEFCKQQRPLRKSQLKGVFSLLLCKTSQYRFV